MCVATAIAMLHLNASGVARYTSVIFSRTLAAEGLPLSSLHLALYEFYDTLPRPVGMPSAATLQPDRRVRIYLEAPEHQAR